VQGFGNVGYNFARLAQAAGFTVVAVSDSSGGLYQADGLDIEETMAAKRRFKKLAAVPAMATAAVAGGASAASPPITASPPTASPAPSGGRRGPSPISNQEILAADCDVLVPAALENAVTEQNAAGVKALAVLELANGPTTPAAEARLAERGIEVIPDVLANSGGVAVSYLEWVQNRQGQSWTERQVNDRLSNLTRAAFQEVWRLSRDKGISLRSAAFALALRRLEEAHKARGKQ
jgi:glutamate dehydrogenase (NADP+)